MSLLSTGKEAAYITGEFRDRDSRLEMLLEKSTEPLRRRDRHDIIVEILKTAREGEKKTYIMYKARLSHSQLQLYLGILDRNGMIIKDNGVYKTTSKGLSFIKEFESVNHLFRQ